MTRSSSRNPFIQVINSNLAIKRFGLHSGSLGRNPFMLAVTKKSRS